MKLQFQKYFSARLFCESYLLRESNIWIVDAHLCNGWCSKKIVICDTHFDLSVKTYGKRERNKCCRVLYDKVEILTMTPNMTATMKPFQYFVECHSYSTMTHLQIFAQRLTKHQQVSVTQVFERISNIASMKL